MRQPDEAVPKDEGKVEAKKELDEAVPKAEGKVEAKKESEAKVVEKDEKSKKMKVLKLTPDEELTVQMAVDNFKPEDLRPEFRDQYMRAAAGTGVCSSCRWTYGCLRCDERKAWNYWVRQELGLKGSVAKKGSKAAKK
jgi:hypothetical protein